MSDRPAPRQRRRRNPRGAGVQLRAEIVTAATEMLAEQGYEHVVTLRAVARRVGIAPTAIYAHFTTPEDIVTAVVFDTFDRLNAHIWDAVRGVPTPRERLFVACRAYMRFGSENAELYGLLFSRNRRLRGESTGPLQASDLEDPEVWPFGHLARNVRESIADGSSDATSVLDTAVELWVAIHGLVVLRATQAGFPWPDRDRLETDLITTIARLRPDGPEAVGRDREER